MEKITFGTKCFEEPEPGKPRRKSFPSLVSVHEYRVEWRVRDVGFEASSLFLQRPLEHESCGR